MLVHDDKWTYDFVKMKLHRISDGAEIGYISTKVGDNPYYSITYTYEKEHSLPGHVQIREMFHRYIASILEEP